MADQGAQEGPGSVIRRRKNQKNGNTGSRPAEPESEDAHRAEPEEPVYDHFAEVLRALGDGSFDLDDMDKATLKSHLASWARHVLMGGERPQLDGEPLPGLDGDRRDWTGLLASLRSIRERESAYVGRTVSDLREVIHVVVRSLGRAVTEDRRSDDRLGRSLTNLNGALESNDLAMLRREVQSTVSIIESVVEARRIRHEKQLEDLAGKLEKISVQLVEARGQAEIDPLTKCYSRSSLDKHLDELVEMGVVLGKGAVLYMIDVDHFKWVNDKFGHPVGDRTIQSVALALRRAFQRSGDFVARYGGDEFAAVVQTDAEESARVIADRALFAARDVEIPHPKGEEAIRISISIGAAPLHPGERVDAWLARADRALYRAKAEGRDRAVVDFD